MSDGAEQRIIMSQERVAAAGSAERTPLIVIGGFLGAGKTTLLNHILRGGRRYAVLVNDFGDINVDASLVRAHDGLTMQLENGCICCTLTDGFAVALERVLAQAPRPEAIVVEASGVGDPWRIAEFALIEPSLRLDAVIGLVDTTVFLDQLQDPLIGDTVSKQLRRSDLILLNKADLADDRLLAAAAAEIRTRVPDARLLSTEFAAIAEEIIDSAGGAERSPSSMLSESRSAHHDFRRWTFRSDRPLDRERLTAALAHLPAEVLRLKGFCQFQGESVPSLVQMVGKRWEISPFAGEGRQCPAGSTLTAIGTAAMADPAQLDRIFASAVAAMEDHAG
jgi:G3E family GTPase